MKLVTQCLYAFVLRTESTGMRIIIIKHALLLLCGFNSNKFAKTQRSRELYIGP